MSARLCTQLTPATGNGHNIRPDTLTKFLLLSWQFSLSVEPRGIIAASPGPQSRTWIMQFYILAFASQRVLVHQSRTEKSSRSQAAREASATISSRHIGPRSAEAQIADRAREVFGLSPEPSERNAFAGSVPGFPKSCCPRRCSRWFRCRHVLALGPTLRSSSHEWSGRLAIHAALFVLANALLQAGAGAPATDMAE